MPPPDDIALAQRIDRACDRFEADWLAGNRPSIEAYFGDATGGELQLLRAALEAVRKELNERSPLAADTSIPQATRTAGTSASEADAPSPARIGRFEVRSVLGSGAFGRVYRAHDPQLDREVAIKVPLTGSLGTDADRARFLREARAAATIQHPNICPVYEIGEESGSPYIVTAYVPGQTLAAQIAGRREPLPARQAALIVRKLALALEAAHRKGIVHRDLKPANVMFDCERKDVVIMDFGLARTPLQPDAQATRSGVILGTPAYMSPEQARGDTRAVGPASDVYSLGVILYELLTGRRPFSGSALEVIGQILHVEPDRPTRHRPNLDPRLEAVCMNAMNKDPAVRISTAQALAEALLEVLKEPDAAKPTDAAAASRHEPLGAIAAGRVEENAPEAESVPHSEESSVIEPRGKSSRAAGKARVPSESSRRPIGMAVATVAGILMLVGLGIGYATRSRRPAAVVPAASSPTATTPAAASDSPKRPAAAGGHRRAAEWVLEIGGAIEVEASGTRRKVEKLADLPPGDFSLIGIALANKEGATDERLSILEGLTSLESLNLNGASVTPKGLAVLPSLTAMKYLNLCVKGLRDDDMELMRNMSSLYALEVSYTSIGDAGLDRLHACRSLRTLYLADTKVTSDGLERLRRALPDCEIIGAPPDAAAREHALKVVKQLGGIAEEDLNDLARPVRTVQLNDTKVNDEGMKLLAAFPRLRVLRSFNTRITDAGMTVLSQMPELHTLDLRYADVGNGTLELAAKSPKLSELWMSSTRFDKDGLAHLKGKTSLETLDISWNNSVDDEAMGVVATLTGLKVLYVAATKVTDAGLEKLSALKNLETLNLNTSRAVTDAGLMPLRVLTRLKSLNVQNTQVTDAGAKALQDAIPALQILRE